MPDLDPELPAPPTDVRAEIERAWTILARLNALPPGDFEAMRAILGELSSTTAAPRWTSVASTSATTR